MRNLPLSEAYLLSVLFEEEAAYHYRQAKDMERRYADHDGMERVMYLSDDNEEQAVYGDFVEE